MRRGAPPPRRAAGRGASDEWERSPGPRCGPRTQARRGRRPLGAAALGAQPLRSGSGSVCSRSDIVDLLGSAASAAWPATGGCGTSRCRAAGRAARRSRRGAGRRSSAAPRQAAFVGTQLRQARPELVDLRVVHRRVRRARGGGELVRRCWRRWERAALTTDGAQVGAGTIQLADARRDAGEGVHRQLFGDVLRAGHQRGKPHHRRELDAEQLARRGGRAPGRGRWVGADVLHTSNDAELTSGVASRSVEHQSQPDFLNVR